MTWIVRDDSFSRDRIDLNGCRFLIGNGYMGYRGTMEEYGREQHVACTLAGLYDRVGDRWREPVNVPNGLLVRVYRDGRLLSTLSDDLCEHAQWLDLRRAVHGRRTRFRLPDGLGITVEAERFCSLADVHLQVMAFQITCSADCEVTIETGIDQDVWDINGPHLKAAVSGCDEGSLWYCGDTQELGHSLAVAERLELAQGAQRIERTPAAILRRIGLRAEATRPVRFVKYVSIFTSLDCDDPYAAALADCEEAARMGYDLVLAEHEARWAARWRDCDVAIEGDDAAELALRHSMYLLLTAAPIHSDRVSIPARGLSAQVYKGAVFWDTEMFMLPFFTCTQPDIARRLVRYRCHTLDGARRKAAEYGHRGAFYAWESQDTGDDACTDFNINDVFTGRPIRTYFRDKQIHISADVAVAIWRHHVQTGDERILLDGGAEAILEAARFFCSWAYYKPDKQRFELLDVVGPDEYHDRVHNNAYTNRMARETLDIADRVLVWLETHHADTYADLISRLNYAADIDRIRRMRDQLYVPAPDPRTGVIEQFDGYFRLEDCTLDELKGRILDPNEYLGGHGPAATTRIIKQADVIMMLNVFADEFPVEVLRANWQYYEPRTEHGSSLSACSYAIVAAHIGEIDWAYRYFMKTATVDLKGESKQYVGDLYIGGTHPAANGGAWMTAVHGFAGLRVTAERIELNPRLPGHWRSFTFSVYWRGQRLGFTITPTEVTVRADDGNTIACPVVIDGVSTDCPAGSTTERTLDE